jgi:putative alpha-1,2-mannosidase
MIGQYAHGNEPSHHILYLYAYSNEPKTGHKYIHKVINEFHNNTPNGMIGNDDCGQMSAWYILSTLGFYPVNSTNGEFVFGSPQVKKAIIQMKGWEFTIEAKNYSNDNIYNENRFLNGQKISTPYISYKQIIAGGTLQFEMTKK